MDPLQGHHDSAGGRRGRGWGDLGGSGLRRKLTPSMWSIADPEGQLSGGGGGGGGGKGRSGKGREERRGVKVMKRHFLDLLLF